MKTFRNELKFYGSDPVSTFSLRILEKMEIDGSNERTDNPELSEYHKLFELKFVAARKLE